MDGLTVSFHEDLVNELDTLIRNYFTVVKVAYQPLPPQRTEIKFPYIPIYEIIYRSDISSNLSTVHDILSSMGFVPMLRSNANLPDSRRLLFIFPLSQKQGIMEKPIVPVLLAGATVLSLLFVGLLLSLSFVGIQQGNFWSLSTFEEIILLLQSFSLSDLLSTITMSGIYTVGLMAILGVHESGHILASRKHGVKATLPYFIPMPFGFGTLGAFIMQKSPIKDRDSLFDLGISGPLSGFLVALPVTFVGLILSYPIPIESIPQESAGNIPWIMPIFIIFSQIIWALPSDYTLVLHPLAFAGWIGFLVTALNLFPIGQLDGGHVARSIVSERNQRYLSFIAAVIMIILGFWLMALLMYFLFSPRHVGPADDVKPISTTKAFIGLGLALIMFILCLPIPTVGLNLLLNVFTGLAPFLG